MGSPIESDDESRSLLIAAENPHGTLEAIVEQTTNAVYLYLQPKSHVDFQSKALWICNLAAAPEALAVEAMARGEAPMNPARFVRDAGPSVPPDPSDLRLVWLPEGNGVALFEGETLLAAIPPASGTNGFWGYARNAVGEGPLAWSFDSDKNGLAHRFAEAERLWRRWQDESPWPAMQERFLAGYEAALGKHSHYFAIDGGAWPPRAIARIPAGDHDFLVTLGVSTAPQPNVELAVDNPRSKTRFELATVIPSSWSDTAVQRMCAYMSGLAAYPWRAMRWLGVDHSVPASAWGDERFVYALLQRGYPGSATVSLPAQGADAVNLLWLIPITAEERTLASRDGTVELLKTLPADRPFQLN